jgi:hypothetical protein
MREFGADWAGTIEISWLCHPFRKRNAEAPRDWSFWRIEA